LSLPQLTQVDSTRPKPAVSLVGLRVARSGNCDPAVTRRLLRESRILGFVFEIWSGARDLNPGPHGPEPCARRSQVWEGQRFVARLPLQYEAWKPSLDLVPRRLWHQVLERVSHLAVAADSESLAR